VRRVAKIAALFVITIAIGMVLAVIFIDSAMFSSTHVESTPSKKSDANKTGPWVYDVHGVGV
jgi:flagellar basal body-associated protein FliL